MWHEKLVVICLIANFLNFHLTKSNFRLVAICSIKGHLDYLFRIEEVLLWRVFLFFFILYSTKVWPEIDSFSYIWVTTNYGREVSWQNRGFFFIFLPSPCLNILCQASQICSFFIIFWLSTKFRGSYTKVPMCCNMQKR